MRGTGDVLEVGQDSLAEVAKNERRSVRGQGIQTVDNVAHLVISELDVSGRRGAYTTVMWRWVNSVGR